jgi:hypothetical protein
MGEPFLPGGQTAWVAPARDGPGRDLVLKAGRAHEEAEHEVEGLPAWQGMGVVGLQASARLPARPRSGRQDAGTVTLRASVPRAGG